MSKMADQLRNKLQKRPSPHEQLIMGNSSYDEDTLDPNGNQEPEPPKKKKPGPKATYKMRKITINVEEVLDVMIDRFCAENRLKKSEFIRKTVHEKMKELGYDAFSKEA